MAVNPMAMCLPHGCVPQGWVLAPWPCVCPWLSVPWVALSPSEGLCHPPMPFPSTQLSCVLSEAAVAVEECSTQHSPLGGRLQTQIHCLWPSPKAPTRGDLLLCSPQSAPGSFWGVLGSVGAARVGAGFGAAVSAWSSGTGGTHARS